MWKYPQGLVRFTPYYSDKELLRENRKISRALLKYGRAAFILDIICFGDEDTNILEVENVYLNLYFWEYNIAKDALASMKGIKLSDATKAKMSAAKKGKYLGKYLGRPSPNRKAVIAIPIDGTTPLNFDSATACANAFNVSLSNPIHAIRRGSIFQKKYRLYYLDEYNNT